MQKVFFIVGNFLIILFGILTSFILFGYLTSEIISRLVSSLNYEFGSVVVYGAIAWLVGSFAALLSLIPSYKICMRMGERLRFRGWPLYHPRRLFALSLFLLILPIILLMLSGIVFGA